MEDTTVSGRLDAIARRLESLAGIEPAASIAKDPEVASKLKRIEDAISSTGGALQSHDIGDHNDASLDSPAVGDLLQWDGNDWALIGEAALLAIADLTDVDDAISPTSGDIFQYDGTEWTAVARDSLGITLDDLDDATITSATDLDLLQYDNASSNWVNRTIATILDGTYIRRDGTTELTGDWSTGAYYIDSLQNAQGSYDNISGRIGFTTTGNDISTVYRPFYSEIDYTIDTGHLSLPTFRGFYSQIEHTNSGGTVLGLNASAFASALALNGETLEAVYDGSVGINIALKDNTTGTIFGAYTKATNAGTGIAYGYQGYGYNTSAGTGTNAIGVYGFAKSDSGRMIGLSALPFSYGTKSFGISSSGNSHFNQGVMYLYATQALQDAVAKTHIATSDKGSLWIEAKLEVDGVAYFDDDVEIPTDNKKLSFGADGSTDSYLQWDATGLDLYSSGGVYDFNAGTNTDITLNFIGTTNSGVLSWMEDEDYFQFADNVYLPSMVASDDCTIAADSKKLSLGADGSTDSYLQWDGSNLDLYSFSGVFDFNTAADTDITFNFIGTTASGVLKWMEDEDYFKFDDSVFLESGCSLYFEFPTNYFTAGGATSILTISDIFINADYKKLVFGLDGIADSYVQWDGSGFDFYSGGGTYVFGAAANTDINFTFSGTTNSGAFKWMEDEDYFEFDDNIFIADGINVIADTTTGTKIGTATTQKLGFYNATPVVQPTALTATLTGITHTAPGTPDYALQDLVDSGAGSAFGFATKDEGNTLLSVVANLQTRVDELEDKLQSLGFLA